MFMGRRRNRKLRILVNKLKDRASVIKATLSTKPNAKIHATVLRATTHFPEDPPSESCIAAVLSHGDGTRQTAGGCVGSLMDRLNATRNPFVALKCLFTIHAIVTRGSFILKDQLSYYPSFGGRNFLNMSNFAAVSDPETWEFSSWVRWYAVVLEHNLMVTRFLGHYLHHHSNKDENVLSSLNTDLVGEIDVLVAFVEQICEAPESLHLQRNNLVYEIVRMVSEDHRLVQQEIFLRVMELGHMRMPSLGSDELTQLWKALERLEGCRKRVFMVFVNRNRHDALWELVSETKTMIMERMWGSGGEMRSLVKLGWRNESSELTQWRPEGFTSSDEKWLVWNQLMLPSAVSTSR